MKIHGRVIFDGNALRLGGAVYRGPYLETRMRCRLRLSMSSIIRLDATCSDLVTLDVQTRRRYITIEPIRRMKSCRYFERERERYPLPSSFLSSPKLITTRNTFRPKSSFLFDRNPSRLILTRSDSTRDALPTLYQFSVTPCSSSLKTDYSATPSVSFR